MEIARRSRGTPRIANRMLRRVRDFAQVKADGVISRVVADNALQALEISLWSMISGFGELFCRLFMAFVAIYWIGSDALFLAEPLAWFGALVFVMIPYFFYQKKLLPKA